MPYKRARLIVFACFFMSGIAGLIYEVLWARYLSLIFGSTAYAHTLVLATFMGGLALGSFLLGKIADNIKKRLNFYAWLEMGIAAFAILTPGLLDLSKDLYITIAKSASMGNAGINALKFAISALIMLPPTILMGGTLPLLSKALVQGVSERGKVIASLYYINSFGAVAGTILAGFYLISHFGLAFSVTVAALINFIAGLSIFILANVYEDKSPAAGEDPAAQQRSEEAYTSAVIAISLAAIFLSGFVSMLYEIVWIRLLSVVLGSSTYSFSLMLAAFISGITIGSFIISKKMPKQGETFLYFGLCEIAIGMALLLSLPFYEKLPYFFAAISSLFARTESNFAVYQAAQFVFLFIIMLPPTVFIGMSFPLAAKVVSSRYDSLGRKVGSALASNTAGNILGTLVSGLLLVPVIGLKRTLELGVIVNLAVGVAIVFKDRIFSPRTKYAVLAFCSAVFVAYAALMPDWNQLSFLAQLFRRPMNPAQFTAFMRSMKEKRFLFHEDGISDSVAVVEDKKGIFLYVNGKIDASSGADMPTQMLVAHIPLMMKPDAKEVLVVGVGSGVTCGSALLHPIKGLDVVEISPSVIKASDYFSAFNYNALKNPRLSLHLEDAKTFLQVTEKKYDVIINEPSNPWVSGNSGLFSVEFFGYCLSALNEEGIMLQWVQAYELSKETFSMILRTFSRVFPEVTIWGAGTSDIILVGSRHKINPDFDGVEKRMNEPSVRADLARIKIYDPFTFLGLQLASAGGIKKAVELKGTVNSDYYPILEYRAPVGLYIGANIKDFLMRLDERRMYPHNSDLFIKDYIAPRRPSREELKNFYGFILDKKAGYNMALLPPLVEKWHSEYPDDKDSIVAYASYNAGSAGSTAAVLEKALAGEKDPALLARYASLQLERYYALNSFFTPEVFTDVVAKLNWCVDASGSDKPRFYYLLGRIYLNERDYEKSLGYYLKAEEGVHSAADAAAYGISYADFLNDISIIYFKIGDLLKMREYAQKMLKGV